MITKNTRLCISIAEKPGNFGSVLFNTCFTALSLDYVYKPCCVASENLEKAMNAVRSLGIRGCGVSMPHKLEIMRYLDEIDAAAKKIGAVNTVVNNDGKLFGCNTDFEGASKALREMYDVSNKAVFIVGAGGAARAIIVALQKDGAASICITSRDEVRGKKVAKEFDLQYCPYNLKDEKSADLFVNATPVGMSPEDDGIIKADALKQFNAVMDVVVSAESTKLIKMGEGLGLTVIPGFKMATHQAMSQFKLYTGVDVPKALVEDAIKIYFQKSDNSVKSL